ncbi:unnamed protein product, partial [Prunus brigantina]
GPGYILTSPHTIISPLIRRDAPGHVRGLSTCRLIQRRVRPPLWAWLYSHQPAHNHISPHTSGRTRPRTGSVNTPATPTTRRQHYLGSLTVNPGSTYPNLVNRPHGAHNLQILI